MKLNLKYIIAVSALVGMAGCDDKIEPFEITGSTATPVAISGSSSGRFCLYADQI